MVDYLFINLQIDNMSEVKVKGQGHRGQIIDFRMKYIILKSFHPIFTKFNTAIT